VNERHLSVPTLPNNWNVFKFPYLIPVSYFHIVRRYRMSHLKLGFIRSFFFYLTKSQFPSSCIRIVFQYRMSHLKGNLKLGFHQKLCFTSQNLVPFFMYPYLIHVLYFHIVLHYHYRMMSHLTEYLKFSSA
jgi:hypothetical protein